MTSDDQFTKMTPEEMLAFQPTDEEQRRAVELTDKNKNGKFSAEEAAELAQLMQFNNLVTLLKIKAYKALNTK